MEKKQLKNLSEDEKFIYEWQRDKARAAYQGALAFAKNRGKKEGIEIGIKIGIGKSREKNTKKNREKWNKTLVVNLLKKGMSFLSIGEVSAWSADQVVDFKNNDKKLQTELKRLERLSQQKNEFSYKEEFNKSFKRDLMNSKIQGIKESVEIGIEVGIGIEKSIKKDRAKEKKILVVNLLKKNRPISFISEATNWSEKKILKIMKDIKLKK